MEGLRWSQEKYGLVPHRKIRSDCVIWGGVQQVLLEVFWVPEACWLVSGRKDVVMNIEVSLAELWLTWKHLNSGVES